MKLVLVVKQRWRREGTKEGRRATTLWYKSPPIKTPHHGNCAPTHLPYDGISTGPLRWGAVLDSSSPEGHFPQFCSFLGTPLVQSRSYYGGHATRLALCAVISVKRVKAVLFWITPNFRGWMVRVPFESG